MSIRFEPLQRRFYLESDLRTDRTYPTARLKIGVPLITPFEVQAFFARRTYTPARHTNDQIPDHLTAFVIALDCRPVAMRSITKYSS